MNEGIKIANATVSYIVRLNTLKEKAVGRLQDGYPRANPRPRKKRSKSDESDLQEGGQSGGEGGA